MTDNTSKILSKLQGLGIYQIIGGALGVIPILLSILNGQQTDGITLAVALFLLLFFVFSIYCGVLCLKKDYNSIVFSLINQILQVIGFAIAGFVFQYVAGAYLTTGFDLTESFDLAFGVGISKIDFYINNKTQRLEVHFNLIALALIIFIEKKKKRYNEEKDKDKVSSIATS